MALEKQSPPNSKNSKDSFQYGAFLLENILGVPGAYLSKKATRALTSRDYWQDLLTPKFIKRLNTKLRDIKDDYGSAAKVRRRREEEASYIFRSKKSRKRSSSFFDNSDAILEAILQTSESKISKTEQLKLLKQLNALHTKSSGDADRFNSFVRPAANNASPKITNAFEGLKAFPSDSSSMSAVSSTLLQELVTGQENSYKLLQKNFPLIDLHFKDLIKAVNNIPAASGMPGVNPADLLDRGLGKSKKGSSLLKKAPLFFSKALPVIGAPVAAALAAQPKLSAINKAEQLGLFTPEQAQLLRSSTKWQAAGASVGGIAGGLAGGAAFGPVGGIAGAYLGYEGGSFLGHAISDRGLKKKGFDQSAAYLATVANMESSLQAMPGPTGTSQAAGLFQFIPKTWEDLNKKYKKGWQISATNDPRLDPKKSIEMMKLLTAENQKALETKLNRSVTGPELYLAHFLGSEGATKMLGTNEGANASLLLPAAAQANPNIFYNEDKMPRTVGEVKATLSKTYIKRAGELNLPTAPIIPSMMTAAPMIQASAASLAETPSVSDAAITGEALATNAKNLRDQAMQDRLAGSLDQLTKVSSKSNDLVAASVSASAGARSSMMIAGGSTGRQTVMSDINSIHFMDGMLLNILF